MRAFAADHGLSEAKMLFAAAFLALAVSLPARAMEARRWTLPVVVADARPGSTRPVTPRPGDDGGDVIAKRLRLPDIEPAADAPPRADSLPYEIVGSFLGVLQAQSADADECAHATARFELEIEASCGEAITVFAALEAINGDGPSVNLATLSEVNANAGTTQDAGGADHVTIREAFAEFGYGRVSLAVGRLDAAAFIDANEFANDERSQFISGAFVNNGALMGPRDEFTPGFAAVIDAGALTVSILGMSDDNTGDRIFDSMFGAFELAASYGAEGRAGNLRAYASVDGAGQDSLGDAVRDVGFGVSLDQELNARAGLFARYASRDTSASDAEVESSWSVGVELHAFRARRGNDTAAVAYGELRAPGVDTSEQILETYYRVVVGDGASISFHLQTLSNPECDPANGDVVVFGARTQLTF